MSANMRGVYLHIIADTLGSVALIISSLCVEHLGWLFTDALCSVMISLGLLATVFPLIRETASVLLQREPVDMKESITAVLDGLPREVVAHTDAHVWTLTPEELVGSIRVQVPPGLSADKVDDVQEKVQKSFAGIGVKHMVVEASKEDLGEPSIRRRRASARGDQAGGPEPNVNLSV